MLLPVGQQETLAILTAPLGGAGAADGGACRWCPPRRRPQRGQLGQWGLSGSVVLVPQGGAGGSDHCLKSVPVGPRPRQVGRAERLVKRLDQDDPLPLPAPAPLAFIVLAVHRK